MSLFERYEIESVVHLAAQAGVRYSLESPETYIQSNIIGYFNLIETLRIHSVKHMVFASSSSVYGANERCHFRRRTRRMRR